jgi:hypothetical protein
MSDNNQKFCEDFVTYAIMHDKELLRTFMETHEHLKEIAILTSYLRHEKDILEELLKEGVTIPPETNMLDVCCEGRGSDLRQIIDLLYQYIDPDALHDILMFSLKKSVGSNELCYHSLIIIHEYLAKYKDISEIMEELISCVDELISRMDD